MIKGSLLWNCLKAAVGAIPLNLMMSAVTLVICIVLGTLIAMVRVYKVPVLKPVMDVLMALSKAFPMNLVLLIFYLIWTTQFSRIAAFFHSQKTIKDVSLMYVAVAALVFCSLASISEIIRSGLISVDKGQYEAGYASGLTKAQTFFHVIVPQAGASGHSTAHERYSLAGKGNGVSVGHRSVRYSDGFHQRGKCGVLLPGGVCGGSPGILGHRNCVRAAEPLCGTEIFKER